MLLRYNDVPKGIELVEKKRLDMPMLNSMLSFRTKEKIALERQEKT